MKIKNAEEIKNDLQKGHDVVRDLKNENNNMDILVAKFNYYKSNYMNILKENTVIKNEQLLDTYYTKMVEISNDIRHSSFKFRDLLYMILEDANAYIDILNTYKTTEELKSDIFRILDELRNQDDEIITTLLDLKDFKDTTKKSDI